MNRLHFWIGLALLGFLLYIAPGFLVHRMYEGFETAAPVSSTATTVNPVEPVVNAIKPSAPPATVSQLLEAIQGLTAGITETPSMESPTAPTPVASTQGAKKQPEGPTTQRSQPASVKETEKESEALKQGAGFIETKPFPSEVDRAHQLAELAPSSAKRSIEVMTPMENPNCPDMRDYIRKDAIPCWSCNLK
jgi:hypothetical protein